MGTTTLVSASADMYLLKLNTNGDVQWVKQMKSSKDDNGHSIRYEKKTNTLFWSGAFSASLTIDGATITPVGTVTPVGIKNILMTQVNPSDGSIIWYTTVKGAEGFFSSLAIDDTGAVVLAANIYAATTPATIEMDSTTLTTSTRNTILLSRFVPEAICFDVASTAPSVCSSQGTCIANDTCSCYPNYRGAKCEIPICYSILANSSAVCNFQNGTCIAANTCNCTMGYSGLECQIPPPMINPKPTPKPSVYLSPNIVAKSGVEPKPERSEVADVVSFSSTPSVHTTIFFIMFLILINLCLGWEL